MPAWVAPAIIAGAGAILNSFGNWRARKINEGYVRAQNEYNSPRSQMQRFQAAGLNPHLVYSQGNPGNQAQALSSPEGMSRLGSDAVSSFNQSAMTQSQVSAQSAQVARTKVLTDIDRIKKMVLQNNPMLDEDYVNAIVRSMLSSARAKESQARMSETQADWFTGDKEFMIDGVSMHGPAGVLKMETELKSLIQKYDLNALDAKIKAQVIESKEFANDLLEIQKKWMADGDITPQHIYQFVMMFLTKLVSR